MGFLFGMRSLGELKFLAVRLHHIAGLLIILSIASSLFWLIWVPRTVQDMLQTKEADLQRQVEMVAESIKPFVIGKQIAAVHSTLEVLRDKYPDWIEINLFRPNGKLLYPLIPSNQQPSQNSIIKSVALIQGDLNLANLEVRLDIANEIAKVKQTQLRAGVLAGIFFLIVVSAITILLSLIENANIKLKELVRKDVLTGLFSRRAMQETFIDKKREVDYLLFLIDIDYFKSVNDIYGHDVGDKLLKFYGALLTSVCGQECFPVRMGGEEFAIIRPWNDWENADAFANELLKKISNTEIEKHGQSIRRTCSIGYAKILKNQDFSDGLNLADFLLREAKKSGRNRFIGADPQTMENLKQSGAFHTEKELRTAIEKNEIVFHGQPIMDIKTNHLVGIECLVRWEPSEGAVIGPANFIHALYEAIRSPEHRLLFTKARANFLQSIKSYPEVYVAFNFTLNEVCFAGAAQQIHTELSSIRDHPDREFVIEISEAAINERIEGKVIIQELKLLSEMGYKIALDDFGVESSNLKRLQEFPIDIVKIDKSLVDNIDKDKSKRLTIEALGELLKKLNIKTIVEGIETIQQTKLLSSIDLYVHQGFAYSRPLRANDVTLYYNSLQPTQR